MFLTALLVFFVRCNNGNVIKNGEQINFPKDDNGYPQGDIVVINGEEYHLDKIEQAIADSHAEHEIDLKLNDKAEGFVKVILPQNNPVCLWSVESNEYIDLVSYSKYELKIKDKNILDGVSANLQTFRFTISKEKGVTVSFKWSNINEIEKSFSDKVEYYLLKIKISH
jgi:cation/multidrug efflux pump